MAEITSMVEAEKLANKSKWVKRVAACAGLAMIAGGIAVAAGDSLERAEVLFEAGAASLMLSYFQPNYLASDFYYQKSSELSR